MLIVECIVEKQNMNFKVGFAEESNTNLYFLLQGSVFQYFLK